MTAKEHRDVYIAAGVGGLGLVLILLYLFGGTQSALIQQPAATPDLSGVPGPGDYNYNITPYDPAPPISNAAPINFGGNSAPGGGCCDDCGPQTGAQYFNPTVAQYQTLQQGGA